MITKTTASTSRGLIWNSISQCNNCLRNASDDNCDECGKGSFVDKQTIYCEENKNFETGHVGYAHYCKKCGEERKNLEENICIIK